MLNRELCFLIQPRASLTNIVNSYAEQYDPDIVLEFREPSVWINNVHSRILSSDEQIKVKLLWLTRLYEESTETDHEGYRKLIEELLGNPPFRETVFDKWWTIELLRESPVHYEEIEQQTYVTTLDLMAETGNRIVDSWLKRLIVTKTSEKQ